MLTANITWSYSICYCIYFAIIWLVQSSSSQQLFSPNGKPAPHPAKLLWLHAAGIFWLGLVPLTVANPVINTMVETSDTRFVLMASYLAALLLAVYVGARDARKFTFSPTLRVVYPESFYRRYLTLRIPFLISYELFFRGHLLFFNTENMGLPAAILADVVLTVFLHIISGRKWMLGCIPFSFAACIINTQAHAVWPSILLHLALSMSFELTVINKLFNPIKSAS